MCNICEPGFGPQKKLMLIDFFSLTFSTQLMKLIPASSLPATSFLAAQSTGGRRRQSVTASRAFCRWTAYPARACVSSNRTTAEMESVK